MTGNGQLTRGAFIKNDFFRNPHFSGEADSDRKSSLFKFFDFSYFVLIT